jgi:hypothetical protein
MEIKRSGDGKLRIERNRKPDSPPKRINFYRKAKSFCADRVTRINVRIALSRQACGGAAMTSTKRADHIEAEAQI